MPLYKGKGLDSMQLGSFRPISLLSVMSKLVEKMVQLQVMDFMEKIGQLNPLNNAYRRNHGTTTMIAEIADQIYTASDRTFMMIDELSDFDCVR